MRWFIRRRRIKDNWRIALEAHRGHPIGRCSRLVSHNVLTHSLSFLSLCLSFPLFILTYSPWTKTLWCHPTIIVASCASWRSTLLPCLVAPSRRLFNGYVFEFYIYMTYTYMIYFSPIQPSKKYLVIPVILRLAYLPLFLFCNYQPANTQRILPVYIHNDWIYLAIAITMGFSSGYLSSLSMMYCPKYVSLTNVKVRNT